ncbi:hypothetical protein HNY73_003614 [Argiope bruennichi]|uniref:Uncharacterized protein n=1 Tax=Argiope bruennichi TaxID=94029 RepID=A0A8T0FNN4_ARGBR|nr:hypothetical protein HNY73_003614 [Argiope bruennichi]
MLVGLFLNHCLLSLRTSSSGRGGEPILVRRLRPTHGHSCFLLTCRERQSARSLPFGAFGEGSYSVAAPVLESIPNATTGLYTILEIVVHSARLDARCLLQPCIIQVYLFEINVDSWGKKNK